MSGRVLGVLLAMTVAPIPAEAYFEDVAIDARVIAMGTSAQAMVSSASSYYWNPAGLAVLSGPQAIVDYGRPYAVPDLNANTVALAAPYRRVGLAVAWHHFGVGSVYSEDIFTLAAGREAWARGGHHIHAGAALKAGRVGFGSFNDPESGAIVDFGSQVETTFDFGLRWATPWRVDVAWMGRDLTSPNWELVQGSGGGSLPARQEFGLAYRWNRESTVTVGWAETGGDGHFSFNAGLEIWFYRVFAIRSGLTEISRIYDATGSIDDFQFTGGFGITDRGWSIDAAAFTNRDLGASYRLSLTLPLPGWGSE